MCFKTSLLFLNNQFQRENEAQRACGQNACTKRPFAFFQRNTKFYSCTKTAIRFLTAKHKILQLHPSGFSFFYSEMQNFKNCTQTAIRFSQRNIKFRTAAKLPFMTTKHEIFKVVPKQSFAQIDFKNSSNKWTSVAKTFLEPSFLVKIVNDHYFRKKFHRRYSSAF